MTQLRYLLIIAIIAFLCLYKWTTVLNEPMDIFSGFPMAVYFWLEINRANLPKFLKRMLLPGGEPGSFCFGLFSLLPCRRPLGLPSLFRSLAAWVMTRRVFSKDVCQVKRESFNGADATTALISQYLMRQLNKQIITNLWLGQNCDGFTFHFYCGDSKLDVGLRLE